MSKMAKSPVISDESCRPANDNPVHHAPNSDRNCGMTSFPLGKAAENSQPANDNNVEDRPIRPLIVIVERWPRRMNAELAAEYCGESSARSFLKRIGSDYPRPRVNEGRRRLWLKDDLDQAICRTT